MIFVLDIASVERIEVTPFFNLVMVWNRGISFGMGSGHELAPVFFLITSSVIVGVLVYLMLRSKHLYETVALCLVIGGACGNIIDRLHFGAVADFFDIHIAGHHWPAFNVADSTIFCGALLWGAVYIFHLGGKVDIAAQHIEGNNGKDK